MGARWDKDRVVAKIVVEPADYFPGAKTIEREIHDYDLGDAEGLGNVVINAVIAMLAENVAKQTGGIVRLCQTCGQGQMIDIPDLDQPAKAQCDFCGVVVNAEDPSR